MKLQRRDTPKPKREDHEADLAIGQWYWVTPQKEDDEPWLGCVTRIGSNFAELEGVYYKRRIHLDHFDDVCARERNPDRVIAEHVEQHRSTANALMGEIAALTAKLGIGDRTALDAASNQPSQALAVAHGIGDIKKHKAALVKAKTETLPELFRKLERQHRQMAAWMKAQLIPMYADMKQAKLRTAGIEDRIFTVELYAGLVEELVCLREGNPAPNDTKIHLYQRRHYMDEECLANYRAGGMDFRSIEKFDRWLLQKHNLKRLLPSPRCVVAFQVRRHEKTRVARVPSDFIQFFYEAEADRQTFLYIRNGDRVYRLTTGIDFGPKLFPDGNQDTVFNDGQLWMEKFGGSVKRVITNREYEAILTDRKERLREYRAERSAWKKLSAAKRKKSREPWKPHFSDDYIAVTPESVYYDDAMRIVAEQAVDHNRVAVVLQGLLDRSPAFHPHPPWRLWTPEGFLNGIELVYDETRALTPGEEPNFKAYRQKLNESLTRGSMTVGQRRAWLRHEAKKENDRRDRSWNYRRSEFERPLVEYQPYGNPGPARVAEVVSFGRKGQCTFEWERQRVDYRNRKWVPDPDRPGYLKVDDSPIKCRFTCDADRLLNVSAYKAGDYKIFFADPRTRAKYLKWAPLLLAAEDYVKKGITGGETE